MYKFDTDQLLNELKKLAEEDDASDELKEMYEIALRLTPEQLNRTFNIIFQDLENLVASGKLSR